VIICIDLSPRTKDQLEKLLEIGGYRDYSEAVAVAVANQLLLHDQAHANPGTTSELIHRQPIAVDNKNGNVAQPMATLHVPELFSHLGLASNAPRLADYPTDDLAAGDISVDRWIFGQHNKLLPVKATCRALARLMMADSKGSLASAKTASEIASEAVKLGDYLRNLDKISGVHRDEALSFAFPYSDSPNGDKSRLRFANQFVASVTKQGSLTGLPFELKLLNHDSSRSPQILLTEAGWLFAEMRNPILDDGKDGRQAKFSGEELEFLRAHICNRVPAEAFAYKLVLEAIAHGANTPEKVDDALEEYIPKRQDKPFTRAFLTTQRAGVVSRMIDLGLVERIRDGINVTYKGVITSLEFSPNLLRRVV
jgi:hypothetical protein